MPAPSPPVGFQFRERMAGPVSPGVDDPVAGAQRGRQAGAIFVADLRVCIDDLAACTRDPQHTARLTGTASFPGLATNQPLHDGRLLLYAPAPEGGVKLMHYRFGFRSDAGADYFLDGKKILHTPGATPREQVTCYTTIREGGPDGPIWGAGILVFRIRDLPGFLWSMRSTGASRLHGLRKFFGFAAHELATKAAA